MLSGAENGRLIAGVKKMIQEGEEIGRVTVNKGDSAKEGLEQGTACARKGNGDCKKYIVPSKLFNLL